MCDSGTILDTICAWQWGYAMTFEYIYFADFSKSSIVDTKFSLTHTNRVREALSISNISFSSSEPVSLAFPCVLLSFNFLINNLHWFRADTSVLNHHASQLV